MKARMIGLLSLLLVVLVLFMTVARAETTFNPDQFYAHLMLEDKFWREYCGCPAKGYPPAVECVPGHGTFNARLWLKIQKER